MKITKKFKKKVKERRRLLNYKRYLANIGKKSFDEQHFQKLIHIHTDYMNRAKRRLKENEELSWAISLSRKGSVFVVFVFLLTSFYPTFSLFNFLFSVFMVFVFFVLGAIYDSLGFEAEEHRRCYQENSAALQKVNQLLTSFTCS